MTASRLKLSLILAGIAFSGLALLAWTQEWFALTLLDGAVLSGRTLADSAPRSGARLAIKSLVESRIVPPG